MAGRNTRHDLQLRHGGIDNLDSFCGVGGMNLYTCSCKDFADVYARREKTSYMEDLFFSDTGWELLGILDKAKYTKATHYIAIGIALEAAEIAFRESIIADWESDDDFENNRTDEDAAAEALWAIEHSGTIERADLSAN